MANRTRSTGWTLGQPPRARIASYRPIACSVAWTVAGESVGSDGLGIGTIRVADSKPESKSARGLCWIRAWSVPSCATARRPNTPKPATPAAAPCANARNNVRRSRSVEHRLRGSAIAMESEVNPKRRRHDRAGGTSADARKRNGAPQGRPGVSVVSPLPRVSQPIENLISGLPVGCVLYDLRFRPVASGFPVASFPTVCDRIRSLVLARCLHGRR